MIYDIRLTTIEDRKYALEHIGRLKSQKQNFTLIDIGCSANPWTKDYVTHIVDIKTSGMGVTEFIGNISDAEVWNEVLEYVSKNGKFDFLVATHTIEDISGAALVCNMFSKVAKEGYIAVPSKYFELSRHEGAWIGCIHHRWIYDIDNNELVGYPKQNFLEHMGYINDWTNHNHRNGREELQFFWKDDLPFRVVNDDYLGPNITSVIDYYKNLTR